MKNLVSHKILVTVVQKDSLPNALLNIWLTKLQCTDFFLFSIFLKI